MKYCSPHFHNWRNWGSFEFSDLSKITQREASNLGEGVNWVPLKPIFFPVLCAHSQLGGFTQPPAIHSDPSSVHLSSSPHLPGAHSLWSVLGSQNVIEPSEPSVGNTGPTLHTHSIYVCWLQHNLISWLAHSPKPLCVCSTLFFIHLFTWIVHSDFFFTAMTKGMISHKTHRIWEQMLGKVGG